MILAAFSLYNEAAAVEHTNLIDTSDYESSWYDKGTKQKTYENAKVHSMKRKVDHQARPVIGILTEPFRGSVEPVSDENGFKS